MEKPTYDAVQPEDEAWCRLAAEETAADCQVTAELHYHGYTAAWTFASPLTGTDFEKEGQRRYAVAACFYLAFLDLYPKLPEALRAAEKLTLPPWGMLTGVRPDKPITRALMEGKTPEEAKRELKTRYFVPEERAALALETGAVGYQALKRLEKRDIDLYVGIPFCPTRCAYCSFVSQSVERSFSLVEPYVKALIAEIRSGGRYGAQQSSAPPHLLHGRRHPRHPDAGSDGCHPDGSGRILRPLRLSGDHGRDRPSGYHHRRKTGRSEKSRRHTGVRQSSDHGGSRPLRHRPPPRAADTVRAMELVRAYRFPHVNMDLIAGLPEDTTGRLPPFPGQMSGNGGRSTSPSTPWR